MTLSDFNQKKNVLVVISTMGQFPEMYRIAELLKKSENFSPLIYFNLGVDVRNTNVGLCLKNGIDVLDYSFGFIQKQQTDNSIASGSSLYELKRNLKHKFPVIFNFLKGAYYFLSHHFHALFFLNRLALLIIRIRKEKKYLDFYNVKLLVFAEDNFRYYTPWLIKIGHENKTKSVVFPYTFANQFEFLEDAYFYNRQVKKSLMNLFVGWLYPKWTYKYKNKNLLKIDSSLILLSEIFNMSPPNPWVMNSGYSDVIAVESQFMKEYYLKAGIPDSQMLETGFPSLDNLYEVVKNKTQYRKRFSTKYEINDEKPWILCAVPPSQWPRPGVGFNSYDNFLNDFFMFFKQFDNVEFIFKFHPREPVDEILKICDQYKIKYVKEDTVELIGLSDMYIASVSATIRWALAIGLPTINYDLYNYNYGDFDTAQNYYSVVQFEDFKNVFNIMYKNTASLSIETNRIFQEQFALFDGHAGDRILDLFTKLT